MGREIARILGAARVGGANKPSSLDELEGSFGPWIKQQRELRRIPLGYVAARTRIPTDRLLRIESGQDLLGRDGQGRSTARLLALTIGADPDEASCLLGEPPGARRYGPLWSQLPWLRWGMLGVSTAVCLVLAWALANQLLSSEASLEASPEVVYRPDYVERLLSADVDEVDEVDEVDVGAGGRTASPKISRAVGREELQ